MRRLVLGLSIVLVLVVASGAQAKVEWYGTVSGSGEYPEYCVSGPEDWCKSESWDFQASRDPGQPITASGNYRSTRLDNPGSACPIRSETTGTLSIDPVYTHLASPTWEQGNSYVPGIFTFGEGYGPGGKLAYDVTTTETDCAGSQTTKGITEVGDFNEDSLEPRPQATPGTTPLVGSYAGELYLHGPFKLDWNIYAREEADEPPPPYLGMTCGKARFDWYDISKHPTFVKKGNRSCVFLLSNSVAKELLEKAIGGSKTLMQTFGGVIVATLAENYADEIAIKGAAYYIEKRLRDSAWNYLARGAPRALAAFREINAITLAGKVVGLTAVPLTASKILKQIRDKKACVQVNAEVEKKKLRLDWNLVYSPSTLKDPDGDHELTEARVRDRKEYKFAPDKLVAKEVGLGCGEQGEILDSGGASSVFSKSTTVIG